MVGDLIKTYRATLTRIEEIDKNIESQRAERSALMEELNELRRLLGASPVIDAEQATDEPHSAPKNIRVRPQRTRPIRESSSVGQARRVLRIAHGGPLHIDEVIKLIRQMTGLSVNKQTLVSNLSRYVNAGDTFVRTAPNTYALKREREDLILAG